MCVDFFDTEYSSGYYGITNADKLLSYMSTNTVSVKNNLYFTLIVARYKQRYC
jgi:hypothetical protein